jgi:asparagine synthase (glutamine-hydrolysing)
MPGIVGIITKKPRQEAAHELARMVASMRHESFYSAGTWIDERLGVYVGWVQREGEGRCAQPQVNESGDKVLVFAGDEFPDPGTAERLRRGGHEVTKGRGAHVIHTAEEDANFPERLNGLFQGLLVDRTTRTAMLFNDRHAARRVYYHEAKDAFYFAAEAKALLAVKPELRTLDERSLGEWVSCGCVLDDRTLFKGIRILPCAARWVFKGGALREKSKYFAPQQWEEQEPLSPDAFYRELRDVFASNVGRYFEDCGQVGFSLTGGLDTRLIIAWLKPEPETLPCYTFGGPYRETRDVRIARRIAAMCGQKHQVIRVGEDFLSRFAHYAERTVYLTDGATNVLHAPDLYVNEVARQIAPVRLTGNYGDEVLRHRVAFRPSMPLNGVFRQDFARQIAAAGETYAEAMKGDALTDAVNRQVAWFFQGLAALESSQVEMRTPFIDNELIRTLYRSPRHSGGGDLRVQMLRDRAPALGKVRTDLGFAGRGGPMAEAASRFWNRATMRAEYACEHGDPRYVPMVDRAVLGRTLEKTFVGIHKFTHFSLWYRNELAAYVREMLLDRRTLARPYLEARELEEIVDRHVEGIGNYTPVIHKVITLEHIHRLFFDEA